MAVFSIKETAATKAAVEWGFWTLIFALNTVVLWSFFVVNIKIMLHLFQIVK